jgi:putative ABC transport system permease protein
MRKLLRRLTYFARSRRADTDLAEEMEFHRSLTQERLVRDGLDPNHAAYASRRALGNVTRAREEARAVWIWSWLEDLWQDTVYALRSLRRAPAFASALILVTALGIGATNSVFGLIDSLVLKPLPVREPHRLAWIGQPAFSFPLYRAIGDRGADIFSDLFAWNLESANVNWTDELEQGEILVATGSIYSTLGVQPAVGRLFDRQDDRPGGGPGGRVAVISYASWQRRFAGDPSVIGRAIRIQGQPFTIAGVTPRGFFGVAAGLAPEVTIPLSTGEDTSWLTQLSTSPLHIMGRLRDGVSLEQGNAILQRIRTDVLEVTTSPDAPADRRAKFLSRPLTLEAGPTGFSRVRRQFAEPLWLLLALVGLLFAVACATTANLLLARGVGRQRELAIRLAIGAGRGRLLRQFFTESLVWAVLGGALSILVGTWTSNALVAMMTTRTEPIVLDVGPNWRVVLFTLALTLTTVVICSIVSALRATRVAPRSALTEVGQAGGAMLRRWSFGTALVTLQVALTVVLLVGAALFVRSLAAVLSQSAGFDRDNILVVATDPAAPGYRGERVDRYYAELRDRLAVVPGVASISLSVMPPISNEDGNWTQSIAVDGAPMGPESGRYVYFNAVSPGYFSTLGIRVREGRDFSAGDNAASARVVIVSESLAQTFFPGADPIGRLITIGRDRRRKDLQIVGVVGNAKYQTLQEETRRVAYLPVAQQASGGTLFVEVRPRGRAAALAESVRREARLLDAGVPVSVEMVTDRIRESLVKERVMAVLASAVSVAALVLACAGLYGLLAYAVSRQRGEIGLRLALGASRTSVVWLVLRTCVAIAAVGSIVGIGASLALGRFAQTLLFHVRATDLWSMAIAGAIMLAVAACAGLVPARRAASVDPVVALRCD